MNKWILASVLLFSSMSQAALNIETKEVVKVLLANSNKIVLTGDLAGQNFSQIMADYITQSFVREEGSAVTINSINSTCEYVAKTAIIECNLDLYSEAGTVTKQCIQKEDIGESSILLKIQLVKSPKKGLILKSNKVSSSLAG